MREFEFRVSLEFNNKKATDFLKLNGVSKEIIKKVKDGDTQAIWGIIVKYAIAYGAVFIVRFVLDMIGEWF